MKKFDLFDFDLTGGMTDREFKDTLGAVSAFCIYEDATGMHSHTNAVGASLFYTGALANKEPIAIIAIGAGVVTMQSSFRGQPYIKKVYAKNWDTSNVARMDYAFYNCAALKGLDMSNWDTSALTSINGMMFSCASLRSITLPTIPTGCSTTSLFSSDPSLTDVSFGEGCKVYPSLSFSDCPLTYQSVCNVLDALADTPDEGATITFKSGLYAGFTEEQQAVIDGKVADVVANGWTIVNMGA